MEASPASIQAGNAGKLHPTALCEEQNGLMRVVATRIEPDGTMQRRPAPGIAVYHISVDDYVVMAAEPDLAGPLLDLVTAVMTLGGEMLEHGVSQPLCQALPGRGLIAA